MKKMVLATALVTMASASMADVMITGKYKGKISEDSTSGNYKYNGDLDLTLKGKAGDTVFTSTFENIGKNGSTAVTVKQAYIESPIGEMFDFKGGTYKSKDGKGLLQENSTKNRMKFGATVGGFNAAVTQVSGESTQSYELSTKIGSATVMVQNAFEDSRFITVEADLGDANVLFESQEASAGNTNMGVQASVSVGNFDLTGVIVNVKDNAGITQTDGIIGDISDTNNGTSVTGIVAVTTVGDKKLTGKFINKNDLDTVVGKLNVGNWEFGASKTDNNDTVFDASITVKF